LAYLKEEIKAGVIIISALLILSLFTIFIGGTTFFERHDIYYVNVLNAAGLEPGAQVKLGGVRVGRVMKISAPQSPGQKVSVKLGLKEGTQLYEGTEAVISQVGFVGDIYMLLSVEKTSDRRIQVGETIPSIESVDFALLMTKVNVISDSIDDLVNDVGRLFSQSTVEEFEKAIGNTNDTLQEIRGLVKDTRGKISVMLETATDDLRKASDMIDAIKSTAGELENTARGIGKTAGSVENTSENLGDAVDIQSRNITNLINTLNRTAEELEELLQEIKNKPWSIIYKEGKTKNE
jgi:ABC-type transporter Mla subunit MlaD